MKLNPYFHLVPRLRMDGTIDMEREITAIDSFSREKRVS
jgi:hypothetical protein